MVRHAGVEIKLRVHSQIEIHGIVQGVGFRQFVAHLATHFSQNGNLTKKVFTIYMLLICRFFSLLTYKSNSYVTIN